MHSSHGTCPPMLARGAAVVTAVQSCLGRFGSRGSCLSLVRALRAFFGLVYIFFMKVQETIKEYVVIYILFPIVSQVQVSKATNIRI